VNFGGTNGLGISTYYEGLSPIIKCIRLAYNIVFSFWYLNKI